MKFRLNSEPYETCQVYCYPLSRCRGGETGSQSGIQ